VSLSPSIYLSQPLSFSFSLLPQREPIFYEEKKQKDINKNFKGKSLSNFVPEISGLRQEPWNILAREVRRSSFTILQYKGAQIAQILFNFEENKKSDIFLN